MITYISAENASKYNVLFDKAAKALMQNPPEGLSITPDFSINSLNEYFGYLEDLVNMSSTDENINRFFARLPLDEDFFEIDANSRAIKVPNTSFGRYGVGVEGDELAEVVYFTIDRFFDSTDLASDDINIIIQWEAKDSSKKTIAGISKNFGKDIETIPGKIIFGWPISHEITESAGSVKFAVRFYQINQPTTSGESASLVYSFSTLPAEVSINASLNYDLINKAVQEIDHGKIITSRIRNIGIYDASVPAPGEPIVTIPLYVMSPEGNELVHIIDLPSSENSEIKLAISAKRYDIGAIGYDWRKFDYNPNTRKYNSDSTPYENFTTSFEEVPYTEELSTDKEYYTLSVTGEGDKEQVVSSLVPEDRISQIFVDEDEQCFRDGGNNNAVITLYNKVSIATIDSVGKYAVDVTARAGVNTKARHMLESEMIIVPGPEEPKIILPEETENITVTEEDKGIHIVVDDSTVTLTANAVPGENDLPVEKVGANPQVTLSYNWKKVSKDGVALDIVQTDTSMPVQILPVDQLPTDPAWRENTKEDDIPGAKGIFNQEHIKVVQNGSNVVIYPDSELKFYESTVSAQGSHQWIAIDIDSGEDSLEGVTWDDGVHEVATFTSEDENDLGVANGHIVFWFKADEAPVTRKINNKPLTFNVSMDAPSKEVYSASGNELTIMGLPTEGLDQTYYAEVIATRNNVSTVEKSGNYRITNAPEKPVLFYGDAPVDRTIHNIRRPKNGSAPVLRFQVQQPDLSDNLIYLWMKADLTGENDYTSTNEVKAHLDLNGALANLLGETEQTGNPDIILDSTVAEYNQDKTEIIFNGGLGEASYTLKDNEEGLYYCIVINELNNHKAASVGPFFLI